MARIPMVTRTIQTTTAKVLCINVVSQEPFEKEIVLTGTFKDKKVLYKRVQEAVDSETVKAVHIKDTIVNETLYGLPELDFIEHAKILPARNCNGDSCEITPVPEY